MHCGWFLTVLALLITASSSRLIAQDANSKNWSEVGDLQTPRVEPTATLLPDGRVLVTGGYSGTQELASAELYDPGRRAFAMTGAMLSARTNHTATLLRNGQVLVVGGQCHGNTLSSAELYDPSTGEWTATGSLHLARDYHTATLLSNGMVLVAGGSRFGSPPVYAQGSPPGSALDVAELYDPETGKWTVVDDLHTARYLHTATLLNTGDVLVTGGIGEKGPGELLASAELYHPSTKSWTVTDSLPTPLINHTASLLHDGRVLVAGGNLSLQPGDRDTDAAELYNPAEGNWTQTGSLHTVVTGHCATLLPDGRVLVAGGIADPNTLANVELYNPATGTWQIEDGLKRARSLFAATLLLDGQVLVLGGLYQTGAPIFSLASAELYGSSNATVKTAQAQTCELSTAQNTHGAEHRIDKLIRHLMALLLCLVILTTCLVVLTGCIVILAGVALLVLLLRRERP